MERPSSSSKAVTAPVDTVLGPPGPFARAGHASRSILAVLTGWGRAAWARLEAIRSFAGARRVTGVRVLAVLLVGTSVYAVIAYPRTSPGGELAVIVGIATIIALVVGGVSMQATAGRERMGRLLVWAGVAASVWLLQGSTDDLAFTIGRAFSGLAALMFAYLILAYPSGRLESTRVRWFFGGIALPLVGSWVLIALTSAQPPFSTPLVRCAPHCPSNLLFVGSWPLSGSFISDSARVLWLALAWGVCLIMLARVRRGTAPVRQSYAPLFLWAAAYALLLTAFLVVARVLSTDTASPLRSLSTAIVPAIPLMMLLGSTRESLLMGRALSAFVRRLADAGVEDPQPLIASPMQDPSLQILYWRPTVGGYVDATGTPVEPPAADDHRAVTRIEQDGRPLGLVIHDPDLVDQKRFLEAAGAAGVIWFRNAQLAAELRASIADLAASRTRLVEAADAERQRIEHSLHDGAQQHLVGMRLRLELASDAIDRDPGRGRRMLSEIGDQMDEALQDVRNLAKGVYPPLLPEHGLPDAIRSANLRSPWPASVNAAGVGRYSADTEAAVYFCCLEALQNITKHAGPDAPSEVHLWEDGERLCFSVTDEGQGFDQRRRRPGEGLTNMRDRIQTVGGSVSVSSRPGRGTTVRGSVPIQSRRQAAALS